MDKMQEWELYDIYVNLKYSDAPNWEMTRWLMYTICQINTKKQLDPRDMLSFAWDYEAENHKTNITDAEIDKLKEKAKKLSKYMQD